MARKNRPAAASPLSSQQETLSTSGIKLLGWGVFILASGLGLLKWTSADGGNAVSFAAPILILSAYTVIGRAALTTTTMQSPDAEAESSAVDAGYRSELILGLVLFLLVFAVYVYNMCPTMYARDSAELATAIRVLGIPHAPGYPTYVLFGKIFDILPAGNPAYRANLAAAFFAATAAGLCYWIVLRLTRMRTAGLVAGLVLAFSAAFWKQAVAAEVFSLAAMFLLVQVLILLAWLERPRAGLFWLNSMIFGLSLGSHQILLFQLPGAAYALWARRNKISNARAWALSLTFFLAGFAVHLFLPIRASQSPLLNQGNPNTLNRLVRTLTRADYGALKLSAGKSGGVENRFAHSLIMAKHVAKQFTPVGVLLACVGLIGLFRARSSFAVSLVFSLLSFGPLFLWVAAMPVDADTLALIERFYWPSWCLISILVGVGVASSAASLFGGLPSLKSSAFASACLLLPAWLGTNAASTFSQRQDFHAYDLLRDVFVGLPRDAIYLTTTDTVTHGSYYLQFAEKKRHDVIVVGETAYPPRRNPELYNPALGPNPMAAGMLAKVSDPVLAVILNGNVGRSPIFVEGIAPGLEDFVAPVGLSHKIVNGNLQAKVKIVLDGLAVHALQAQRNGFRESSDPFVRQIYFNYYATRYNSGILLNLAGYKELATRELAAAEQLKAVSAPAHVYARLSDAVSH